MNIRDSFDIISEKWYPEVHYHVPKASVIVIGLRWNSDTDDTIDPVSTKEALDLCKKINACAYIEASVVSANNLVSAFNVAVKTGLSAALKQDGISTSHNSNNNSKNHLMNHLVGVKYFNGTPSATLSPSKPKRNRLSNILTSIFQSKPNRTDEIGL
jgi:hypothetical protein